MAFLSLFSRGQLRVGPSIAPSASRTGYEPAFLPPNTRAPSVLGPQPPTFARGREALALGLWTFAVFLSLALASYAGDPAIPLGTDGAPIVGENWVGPVGAWAARGIVSVVGVAAWVVPVEALLLGIPFVRGKRSNMTPARLAADVLLIVIGAALLQVGGPGKLAFGKHPMGGMVGELFGELARSLFSTAGSFLVGFACIGLILIGRATFSFIALVRSIERSSRFVGGMFAGGARRVADAWKRARELERERKKNAEPPPPPISLPEKEEAIVLAPEQPSELPPPVRVRLDTPPEPFHPESPILELDQDQVQDEKKKEKEKEKKPRRRKSDVESDPIAKALAEPEAEAPPPPPEPIALSVTPLEGVDVAPKKKPRANGKKATEFTIVDTSAALEKEKSEPEKKKKKEARGFELPSLDTLTRAEANIGPLFDEEKLRKNAELLVKTLADYKVTGKVEEILPGPVVTTFEVSPVAGTKVSKVAALADDLALALAKKVRIVAPIPGKNRIGFELPNDKRVPVNLRDLVEDRRFQTLDVPLPVVLGRDIVGNPVYADLARMPHAIVAGATGAGKSVGLNVMLTSLLFRRTPEELRLLMIDPKVVELAPYDRIPHMLLPVVTDMKQASNALKWAVDEMERRYQLFADAGTKNIGTYNVWVSRVRSGEIKNPLGKAIVGKDLNGIQEVLRVRDDDPEGEQMVPEPLPMIVIVVDEFADLMMQQGKEVEACVARLAQKARAAGMHVILATQRPSVDVITGMIKANFPTRMAFRVAQKIDSRTILDEQGAEHLLGNGDMLIKLNGTNETKRVQCPWVSEEEVQAITDHLRKQGEPVYDENILKPRDEDEMPEEDDAEQDLMYDDAVRIVAETRRCSTSWLQRKLGLGYNRAARIVEMMERRGLVGPANGAKDREVLVDPI
jgi:S-DNA-T family DNA segregation ATPase FtsK/SpoIIIE